MDSPQDEPMKLEMILDETLRCELRPERVERFHRGGNPLCRYHFSTANMEATAQRQFQDFVYRAATNRWGPAIDRVQSKNSILYDTKIVTAGIVATLLLLGFVGSVYLYDNNDDIFMEHTARFQTVPSDVQATRNRLAAILEEMVVSQESDIDRLLRLYEAAVRTRNPEVSAKTADLIADIYTHRGDFTKSADWKMVSAIMYFRIANRRNDMILQLNDIRITGGEKLLTLEKRYESYMMRARTATEKNDVLTMERFYREAIYLNPENETVFDEWLVALLTMKKKYDAMKNAPHHESNVWISNYEKVLEEFQSMVQTLPPENNFVSKSAMLSEATDQNIPEAITELTQLAKTEPLAEDDQKRLIRLLVKEKRYTEAFPMIRSLDAKIPDTVEFLRLFLWSATPQAANLSESDRDWARNRMVSLLRDAAHREFPEWHEEDFISVGHFLNAFKMEEDMEAATETFLRGALSRIPQTSPIYNDIKLKLAMLLRSQKRFTEAEPLLEELLKD